MVKYFMKKIDDHSMLVTINSLSENTGGGIYARTIMASLCNNFEVVYVFEKASSDKNKNSYISKVYIHSMVKGWTAELISRMFASPTYCFFYIVPIIRCVKRNNIKHVFLHNSRLGVIALAIRCLTTACVYGLSDNREAELSLYLFKESRSLKYKIVRYFDYLLLLFSELLFNKCSHKNSFITLQDVSRRKSSQVFVLPVCLKKKRLIRENNKKNIDFLFTGSFTFEPNIQALKKYINLAKENKNFTFAVAGRQLSTLSFLDLPGNVTLICSPTAGEMDDIFRSSKAYVSLVEHGSGMKTKVLEAFAYGLYVFCSKHSAIGYEKVHHTECLYIYSDLASEFSVWASGLESFDCEEAYNLFLKYYTYDHSSEIIRKMVDNG